MSHQLIKLQAFTYKNFIIIRREIFSIWEIAFWPLLTLISIGLLGTFTELSQALISFMLIGAIAFSMLEICQLDISFALLFDIWSKSVKHTFVAPIRGYHFILGAWLIGILRGSCVYLLLVISGFYFFKFDIMQAGILANFFFVTGIFLNALILGIIVCVFLFLFGRRAQIVAWSIAGLLMLICGFYYPASILPQPIFLLSRFIPLSYFLEYFRSFYGFPTDGLLSLVYGYSLTIIYLIISFLLLHLTINKAKKSGVLLRLSE